MDDAARYWDRIAARYARRPVADEAAYARTLARARAWLKPGDRALEVGCGTGATALALAESGAAIHATDVSGEMIAIARARPEARAAAGVTFAQAALSDPGVDGPWDAVLAFNFLQLAPDLGLTLTRIAGLVRPGGLLISKTVCLGGRGAWRYRTIVRAMRPFGVLPNQLAFHGVAALERAVGEAGFEILERGTFPKAPPSRFLVARRVGA